MAKMNIKYYILRSKVIGRMKILRYRSMKKKYDFDRWHMTPVCYRKYALDTIEYINAQLKNRTNERTIVVEVGCGLCEILSNLRCEEKIGIDLEKNVLNAAGKLNRKKIKLICGTFADINEEDITFLLLINFTHNISKEELIDNIKLVTNRSRIEHIIVDEVISKFYKYNHNYREIIPENYELFHSWGTYAVQEGERTMRCYKLKNE